MSASAQPPSPPAGLTAQAVVEMFRQLGLPVCDDAQAIAVKTREQRDRLLRECNSPDRDLAHRAKVSLRNADWMLHRRAELLAVTYGLFSALADAAVGTATRAPEVVLTSQLKERLQQIARISCHVDELLAERFVDRYRQERGLAEGAQPRAQAAGGLRPRLARPAWTMLLLVPLVGAAGGWYLWSRSRTQEPIRPKQPLQAVPAFGAPSQPWTNTLGMTFVAVPGTKVLFSARETRRQDFEPFVKATRFDMGSNLWCLRVDGFTNRNGFDWRDPGFRQDGSHPVVGVSWSDAKAFCQWLTEEERAAGLISVWEYYRLPTDEEWSTAAGLAVESGRSPQEKSEKVAGRYPWGWTWPPPRRAGNYAGKEARNAMSPPNCEFIEGYRDAYERTAPVGQFEPNDFGLYDLGGNASEWCEDWFDNDQKFKVLRGSSWQDGRATSLLTSGRWRNPPQVRCDFIGFRCVLQRQAAPTAVEPAPVVASTPGSGLRTNYTNRLNMVFRPVTDTRVLFSVWETRRQDFEAFVWSTGHDTGNKMQSISPDGFSSSFNFNSGKPTWRDPGFDQNGTHPVVGVSWTDAKAFCDWLTKQERGAGLIPQAARYRLPTDAEWSMAVGLGTESGETPKDKDANSAGPYPWGWQWPPPIGAGNYAGAETSGKVNPPTTNAFDLWLRGSRTTIQGYEDDWKQTASVGYFRPNKFGLHDLGGNVSEWCDDWFDNEKKHKVLRGASWKDVTAALLRSSSRWKDSPDARSDYMGFRCVLENMELGAESADARAARLQLEQERLELEKLKQEAEDLSMLRTQVAKLKEEVTVAKRLDWIRQGLFGQTNQTGAAPRLATGTVSALPLSNRSLNVEVKQPAPSKARSNP